MNIKGSEIYYSVSGGLPSWLSFSNRNHVNQCLPFTLKVTDDVGSIVSNLEKASVKRGVENLKKKKTEIPQIKQDAVKI